MTCARSINNRNGNQDEADSVKPWRTIGAVLLAGVSGASMAHADTVKPLADVARYFGPGDYPAEAIRDRQEGLVVARLWIDETGKVASCTTVSSSGSSALDQQTCRIALEKMTFTPATDRRGKPVPAPYKLPVRWVLPRAPVETNSRAAGLRGDPAQFFGSDDYPAEALRAVQEGRVVAKLWIDAKGKVASCTVVGSSGSAALDAQTCRIALDKVTFTPATDEQGKPIAATYTLPVRWVLPRGPVEAGTIPKDQVVQVTVSVDAAGQIVACNTTATPPLPVQQQPCDVFPVGKESEFHWMRDGKPVGGTVVQTLRRQVSIDP